MDVIWTGCESALCWLSFKKTAEKLKSKLSITLLSPLKQNAGVKSDLWLRLCLNHEQKASSSKITKGPIQSLLMAYYLDPNIIVKEWSLFTAGGGGSLKIARTQHVPPIHNHNLRFCPPPLRTCALKSCIVPPSKLKFYVPPSPPPPCCK